MDSARDPFLLAAIALPVLMEMWKFAPMLAHHTLTERQILLVASLTAGRTPMHRLLVPLTLIVSPHKDPLGLPPAVRMIVIVMVTQAAVDHPTRLTGGEIQSEESEPHLAPPINPTILPTDGVFQEEVDVTEHQLGEVAAVALHHVMDQTVTTFGDLRDPLRVTLSIPITHTSVFRLNWLS